MGFCFVFFPFVFISRNSFSSDSRVLDSLLCVQLQLVRCSYSQQNLIRTNYRFTQNTCCFHNNTSQTKVAKFHSECCKRNEPVQRSDFVVCDSQYKHTQTDRPTNTQAHPYSEHSVSVHMAMRRSVIRYITMRPYSLDELQYECVRSLVRSFLFMQVNVWLIPSFIFLLLVLPYKHAACFG